MRISAVLLTCALLSACASPKPPTVNGWSWNRQPVNSPEAAAVLALRADMATEARPAHVVALSAAPMVSVYFPTNDATFRPTNDQAASLRTLMRSYPRQIIVRGRTDGSRMTSGDERIAVRRAVAARNWLTSQGTSPARISVNYVSAGDYVADNDSSAGRARNRRVDIEAIY